MAHPDQLLEGLSKYLTEQAAPLFEEASKKAGESDLSSAYDGSEKGRSLLDFAMDIRLFRSRIEENFKKFGLTIPTIEQLVPELAQPAIAETPTEIAAPVTPEPAAEPEAPAAASEEPPASLPAEEEVRAVDDLTVQQEQIGRLYFQPNEKGKDFAHTTDSIAQQLEMKPAEVRKVYGPLVSKLKAFQQDPDQAPEHLAKIVTDIQAQYPGITPEDMLDVLKDPNLTFKRLQNRLNKRNNPPQPAWPLHHLDRPPGGDGQAAPSEAPIAPAVSGGLTETLDYVEKHLALVGGLGPMTEEQLATYLGEDQGQEAAPAPEKPPAEAEPEAGPGQVAAPAVSEGRTKSQIIQEGRQVHNLTIDGRTMEVRGRLSNITLRILAATSENQRMPFKQFKDATGGEISRSTIYANNKGQFARLGFRAVVEGGGDEATIYLERLTPATGEPPAAPIEEAEAAAPAAPTEEDANKRLMPDGQEVKVSANQFKAVQLILNASAEDILLSDNLMDLVYPDPNIPLKDKRNRLSVVLSAIRDGLPENWKLVSAKKEGSRSSGYYFEKSEPATAEAEVATTVATVSTPETYSVVTPDRPSMKGYDNDEAAVVFCLWDSYGDPNKSLTRSQLEQKTWGSTRPDITYFPLPMGLQHKLHGEGHEVGIIEPQEGEKEARYYMKSYTEPRTVSAAQAVPAEAATTTVEESAPAGLTSGTIELARDEEEVEAVDLLLTDKDTFLLAKRICEIDPQSAQLAGLRLTDKDTEEAGKTTEALAEFADSITDTDRALLKRKMLALASNRDGAIDANLANDKAFIVLAMVSGISNPDQVKAFLGSN